MDFKEQGMKEKEKRGKGERCVTGNGGRGYNNE